ncbi:methyltransferase domain-containing protein [Flavobacterium sp.]|uniref:methyltransferase domain-containing protein n=1 Tax=Flavobacterium sp. TaxID=239 RepID=UPI00260C1DFE|nr:methyltransferase domain-containing protein [Flavobacterium sp.]
MKNKIIEYKDRAIFANAMLDKYFQSAPNKVVSDIGAGFGHMQNKIESLGATWQPFDYVRKIEKSIMWDLNNPCPNEAQKAGTIIFLEVLEHLANPLLCLQNIANNLEKGGCIILTTPNPSSSKNTINLFLKGRLYAFQEKHLVEHHVFTPWEHIVKFFLEECGFEIIEYAIIDTQYKDQKKASMKEFIKSKIENYIESRNPKAKGMSYGLVARKK